MSNNLKDIKIRGISTGNEARQVMRPSFKSQSNSSNNQKGAPGKPGRIPRKSRFFRRFLGVIFVLFPITILGGIIGAALWNAIILPYATTVPSLSKYDFLRPDRPVIIEKTEEINILDENSAVIESVRKVSPAVVSILVSRDVQGFFGQVYREQGGGTGFIVTSDGLIVTNKHVVDSEQAEYVVVTPDGESYDAEILAKDPGNDLAVLKIKATNLPVVELGSSSDLQIGQKVIAIGNSLGEYDNSVTTGVVSAFDRSLQAGNGFISERLEGLLQTDAAINPGNSGGPLVNLKGQVIGINTAVDRQGEAIGFAIPSDIAKPAIDSAISEGRIIRPMIGVRYIPLNPEIATLNGLTITRGALVYSGQVGALAVLPNSPASKAGIEEGDIIIGVDNIEIDANRSLASIIQRYKPGDSIELTVVRNNETLTKILVLTEMPN